MGGKHASPRRGRFWRAYLIYVLVLLLISLGVLAYLWHFLADYQRRVDLEAEDAERLRLEEEQATAELRAPQKALEEFLASADADYWTSRWFLIHSEDPEPWSAAEAVIQGLMDRPDFGAYKDLAYTPEAPVYLLKNDDLDFARIRLTGSGMQWSVSETELLLEGGGSARVETVASAAVLWGETEMPPEGEPYSHFPLGKDDRLEEPVLYKTVSVSGTLAQPELRVEPPPGRELAESETDRIPVLLYDGEDGERAMEECEAFVRAVLRYYMSGESGTMTNLNRCLAFVRKGSAAYETLSASYDGITWNYSYQDQNVEDVHASRPVQWAENCFSVDVAFHAKASAGGKAVDYAAGVYRIYYYDLGDGFAITELTFG